MAEVTAMRSNALPYPIYAQPWTIVYPFRDADGDLVTGASSPDAERSLNGDTFADCTNESTEIATSSGMYYLTLTASEMTADIVSVIAKSSTSGMKTAAATLYPRKLVTLRTGTTASGGASTSTVVLDSGASAVDDYYNGCVVAVVIDGGTVQLRLITDYTGSNKTCTVHADFLTAPDSDDTFTVYLPEGMQIYQSDVTVWKGTAAAAVDTAGYPKVTVKSGTGTGEINLSSGVADANVTKFGGTNGTFASGRPEVNTSHIAGSAVSTSSAQIGVNVINAAGTAWNSGAIGASTLAADTITAAKIADAAIDAATFASGAINAAAIAADAITAAKIADGAIDAATFAAGAINAAAIAADAIGASELAADAVTEIATAVNAEVVDALSVDTYAEPGQGNPGATISLAAKIGYLYKAWRNRTTQTSSEYALYADDTTTKDQKAAVSDNGTTFERGEVATGA